MTEQQLSEKRWIIDNYYMACNEEVICSEDVKQSIQEFLTEIIRLNRLSARNKHFTHLTK